VSAVTAGVVASLLGKGTGMRHSYSPENCVILPLESSNFYACSWANEQCAMCITVPLHYFSRLCHTYQR